MYIVYLASHHTSTFWIPVMRFVGVTLQMRWVGGGAAGYPCHWLSLSDQA